MLNHAISAWEESKGRPPSEMTKVSRYGPRVAQVRRILLRGVVAPLIPLGGNPTSRRGSATRNFDYADDGHLCFQVGPRYDRRVRRPLPSGIVTAGGWEAQGFGFLGIVTSNDDYCECA